MKITRLLLRVKKKIRSGWKECCYIDNIENTVSCRKLIRKWRHKSVVSLKRACLIELFHPFFFTSQRFLEALTMETLESYWFLFFRCLLTSPSFPIFKWQIILDNCVLVSCLLMSSVKKNNYLACSLNFTLNLACCSVDYITYPQLFIFVSIKIICNLLFQF